MGVKYTCDECEAEYENKSEITTVEVRTAEKFDMGQAYEKRDFCAGCNPMALAGTLARTLKDWEDDNGE